MSKVNLASATSKRREEFVKSGDTGSKVAVKPDRNISVNTVSKKKATFNMNAALHQKLKIAAATQERDMTELMEEAISEYLDRVGS